ncbi:MAG: MCT family MFS transporter [Dehalococcoidia bacterium]
MTDAARHTRQTTLFYGWAVVAGAFVVMFMGFGAAYTFGAFFHSLRDEFGATRSQIALIFALTSSIYFGLGVVSGRIADRVGPRRVIVAGGILLGSGFLLAAFTQQLWQIYLTYSLCVGLGVGLTYVPSIGTVQRWFVRRRGFASGLAVAGIGLGNLLFPPVAAVLIDAAGWRTAYIVLGVVVLTCTLAAALVIERGPEVRGLLPDGDTSSDPASVAVSWGMTPGEALRTRTFRILYLACIATTLGLFIPFAHLVPYAEDHGLSEFTGAVLLGAIGAGSVGGRLLLGGSADRIGRRQALAGSFVLMAATQLWWLAATQTWSLVVFALLFGAGYGGFVALIPALASDYFGIRHTGALIGLLYTSAAIGSLVGPTLAGVAFDLRDSYTLPILLSAVANLFAAGCMAIIGAPSHIQME